MSDPEEIELAWSAGFYDGEGCTGLTSQGYLTATIGQAHVEVLERFHKAVGGRGRMYGPYKLKNEPNWSPQWRWQAISSEAIEVLDLLWDYLGTVKRNQFMEKIDSARIAHRKGFCKRDLHEMTAENRTSDGRCKPCRHAQLRGEYK